MDFRRITDRPTTVIRQAAVRPLALRWARWAESLLRRHAGGSAAWYSLNAVLRERAGRSETFVDRRVSLALGLYLAIPSARVMVAPTSTLSERELTNVPVRTVFPAQIVRAQVAERISALTERARLEQQYHDNSSALAILRQSDSRLLHTHTLSAVERIYARQGRRYEAWGGAPPITTQIVRQAEATAQVPPAQADPFAPPTQANRFAADGAFRPILHWDSAKPQTMPPDIGRLTDQVIQSIDQRLTASRERYGKR